MAINVREFLGRSAKPALLFTLWAWCAFSTLGQVKVETPHQTNDKIQQLAALNSSAPQGIPVGMDDLIHIDVFDVPELSRDVRVSDAGDISLPIDSRQDLCGWSFGFSASGKTGATPD